MGALFQVRVSAGIDAVSGERIVLTDSVRIAQPGNIKSERAAEREADKLLTQLQAQADALKVARTKATLGALLDRWLPQHEIDLSMRRGYESQIRLYIKPALGDLPLDLLIRGAGERLEAFYSDLRRCRQHCAGSAFRGRARERAVARLSPRGVSLAPVPPVCAVECAPDPRDHFQRAVGGGPLGMDSVQPCRCGAKARHAEAAAAAADAA